MATFEHLCTNCPWSKLDNEIVKECPKCAGRVNTWMDEEFKEADNGNDNSN